MNIRSHSGLTALMIACRNNFRLAAKILMDRDDVDIRVDEVDAGEWQGSHMAADTLGTTANART